MATEQLQSATGDAMPARPGSIQVLLVGNYARDGQESMQRFADAMLHGLRAQGVDVRLVRPPAAFGRLCASSRSGLGKWLGYLDKFVLFPSRLRREIRRLQARAEAVDSTGLVVVHVCDHSNAIYTRSLRDIPHVVTCHDMLAIRSARGEIPENPTRWSGRIFQSLILRGLAGARHIACVSRATEKDLRRISAVPPARVSIVPNSLNYAYTPVPRDEAAESARKSCAHVGRSGPGAGFVLHVGGNHWYKNRLGVLRIYAHWMETAERVPSLVLVGEPLTDAMKEFIAAKKLESHVFPLHHCSNEELRALYSAAGALLFPSLAEGFGWPVIEAQACGCPVVCSDLDPFPEVAGPGAVFAPPGDLPGFAQRLREVIGDADLRSRLIEQGFINASRFRAEAMISGYLDCYAALAHGSAQERHSPEPPREMPVPV